MIQTKRQVRCVSIGLWLSVFAPVSANLPPASATEPLVVFLVRHGEKVDASKDPELSTAGKQRAKQLAVSFIQEQPVSTGTARDEKIGLPVVVDIGRSDPQTGNAAGLGYRPPAPEAIQPCPTRQDGACRPRICSREMICWS